ncbi:MAG: rod shape-determining protein MreC [Breznakibacter sp.]|nr:rod shape-determining protein MreC [Breznakibacter sp.]
MIKIFKFFAKHYFVGLFIILEFITLSMVISFNHYQRSSFLSSANGFTGFFFEQSSDLTDYFNLKAVNAQLSEENAYLRSKLPSSFRNARDYSQAVHDTLGRQRYIFRNAKVINNSVNKSFNYITIDKGSRQGIKPEMGVISAQGVVGVVKDVSENFSTVISLLNTRFKLSAKLKEEGDFGSLAWAEESYDIASFNEIPKHAKVNLGDQVVTSGYSVIFPEGIPVGTIEELELGEGESFYEIKVLLSVDFKKLTYVEVVENKLKLEQLTLEQKTEND